VHHPSLPLCVWPGMASSAAELFVCRYYLRLLRLRHHYKYRVVAGTMIVCWVMHAWMAFPTPASLSLSPSPSLASYLRRSGSDHYLPPGWLDPSNQRIPGAILPSNPAIIHASAASPCLETLKPPTQTFLCLSKNQCCHGIWGFSSGSCDLLLSCSHPFGCNVIYNYKLCVRASVRRRSGSVFCGGTGHRDFLWRNRPQRPWPPATSDPGPETQVLRPRSWEPNAAAPAPKMARITNSVITHRSSGLTNGGKLN
jgi:hypothetical protein